MSASYAPHTTSETLLRVLRAAGPSWARSTNARFIREATHGGVSDDVLGRYLQIERDFVETSARLRAAAAATSPTTRALDVHRRALNSLLDSQGPRLRDAIEHLEAKPEVSAPAWDLARQLSRHVLSVAQAGDYAQILTVILTAEELYATWCAVAARVAATRNPVLTDWIELHVSPPFTDEIAELTSGLEALDLPDSAIAELGACAARVLDLEVIFHDSAYILTKS
ncbi:hypothetical protein [Flexivirga caeni]|uniref:Thiaminase-2/PQQC domain-containing protein n=1 Tax=Flexivirga caeni TaxID=2294115 RepID=A0A3M9MFB8_9MICO|nr:hypothetical protein [Flexivirga caeni]RNI24236.1 hypothetical protein EFY87_04505 [Flexivirga caeni]